MVFLLHWQPSILNGPIYFNHLRFEFFWSLISLISVSVGVPYCASGFCSHLSELKLIENAVHLFPFDRERRILAF